MDALVQALRAQGGVFADVVKATGAGACRGSGPPQKAASGPRAAGNEAEYELLMEMIFEGSLLHYGDARVIQTEDRDLALLLGDRLYALGLERLAALGDLEAVSVLADVISNVAQAHAEGNPERVPAIWAEGASAVGWGS